eukprot:351938-Chlamydomonas_euryale.AAC.6
MQWVAREPVTAGCMTALHCAAAHSYCRQKGVTLDLLSAQPCASLSSFALSAFRQNTSRERESSLPICWLPGAARRHVHTTASVTNDETRSGAAGWYADAGA